MNDVFSGRQDPNTPHTHHRRRFELKTELAAGGSATAYLRRFTGEGCETTDIEFTVHDPDIGFSGDGPDETYHGERGLAEWCHDSQRWEIYQLSCDREEVA